MVSDLVQCILSLAIAGSILCLVWCYNHQAFTNLASHVLAGFRSLLHDVIERTLLFDVTEQLQQDAERLIGPSWRSGTVADGESGEQPNTAAIALMERMKQDWMYRRWEDVPPLPVILPSHVASPLNYTPALEDEPIYSKEDE